jgi:hypothetical protein
MDNVEKANLSYQRKAIEEYRSRQAAIEVQAARSPHAQALSSSAPALSSSATGNGSRSVSMAAIENVETGSGDDMNDDDEQPSQCTFIENFVAIQRSNYCQFAIAKKKLTGHGLSSQTKRTASIVINGDTEDEDIRHLFSYLLSVLY